MNEVDEEDSSITETDESEAERDRAHAALIRKYTMDAKNDAAGDSSSYTMSASVSRSKTDQDTAKAR